MQNKRIYSFIGERWPSGYGVTFRSDLYRDSSERGFESHPLHFGLVLYDTCPGF